MAQTLEELERAYEEGQRFNPTFKPGGYSGNFGEINNASVRNYQNQTRLSYLIAKEKARIAEEQQRKQFDARLSDLMQRADPFASQRGQYATQLSSLLGVGAQPQYSQPAAATAQPSTGKQPMRMSQIIGSSGGGQSQPMAAPPSGSSSAGVSQINSVLQSNPFFQANMDAGQEAASRRLAAMGMGTSGNAALELQKQAQSNMSGEYFKMADLLSGLSGAKADPAAGANAGLGMLKLGEEARQFDYSNQWRQGIQPGQQGTLSAYWGK